MVAAGGPPALDLQHALQPQEQVGPQAATLQRMQLHRQLMDTFRAVDAAGSGTVSRGFVASLMQQLGVPAKVLDPFSDPNTSRFRYGAFADWLLLEDEAGHGGGDVDAVRLAAALTPRLEEGRAADFRELFLREQAAHALTKARLAEVEARQGKAQGADDPRWDVDGFERACEEVQILWVKAGWLRQLADNRAAIPRRQEVPPEGIGWIGAPPRTSCQLYRVSWCWLEPSIHPDRHGFHLQNLARHLTNDNAMADDLVFIDWTACYQSPRDEQQEATFLRAWKLMPRFLTVYFRFKLLCLHELPPEYAGPSYFNRGWPIFEFGLATFALRVVNSGDAVVRAQMTPEYLMGFESAIAGKFYSVEADREDVLRMRRELAAQMLRARVDTVGFRATCEQAGFRWVRVSYLRRLGRPGGGVPPRHQDLPRGAYVDGAPPAGRRVFVLSYPWAAHLHPFPAGGKIREFVSTLDRLGAQDEDVAFIDFLSLPQEGRTLPAAYRDSNPQAVGVVDVPESGQEGGRGRMVALPGREKNVELQFRFALFETTRLYAYERCEVVILPALADLPEDFPECTFIREEDNTICVPTRKEKLTPWGFCKAVPYHQGGWTCAEYAVARKNGTIVNADDEHVRALEDKRHCWPTNVKEFAAMMDEDAQDEVRVQFAKNGDRAAVRFNFYKFCYSLLDKDAPG